MKFHFDSIVVVFYLSTLAVTSLVLKPLLTVSKTLLNAGFGKQPAKLSGTSTQKTQNTQTQNSLKITEEKNDAYNITASIESCSMTYQNHCPSLNTNYPGLRQIHGDPPVYEIDNFFTEEMCKDYIDRSQTLGYQMTSQTFQGNTLSTRTSTTWYMRYDKSAEFISKSHDLTQIPIHNFEEPQIVRYEFGQQFTWHYDYIPKPSQDTSGNRLCTILVYLNDVNSGGATCFKDLGIQVKPKTGKALLFFPCYKDGKIDERTLHAGQVTMDTKWIAQM